MKQSPLTHAQDGFGQSPWSFGERIRMAAWVIVWKLFCAWTPKFCNRWRLLWLRVFGAQIDGLPFVHATARIRLPWHLTLRDRACLGEHANAYSLGPIEIGERSTIAQEVYLCTGTHDFDDPNLPLQTAPIVIGSDVFIGARAFVLPGVSIGNRVVIGACSVVTHDLPANTICAGHPCRVLTKRGADLPA